jgi:hypothetical protein
MNQHFCGQLLGFHFAGFEAHLVWHITPIAKRNQYHGQDRVQHQEIAVPCEGDNLECGRWCVCCDHAQSQQVTGHQQQQGRDDQVKATGVVALDQAVRQDHGHTAKQQEHAGQAHQALQCDDAEIGIPKITLTPRIHKGLRELSRSRAKASSISKLEAL